MFLIGYTLENSQSNPKFTNWFVNLFGIFELPKTQILGIVIAKNYIFRYHLIRKKLSSRVTEQKDLNMMESRNLAIVFWPTLAPPVVATIDNFSRTMNMCLFVQTYIEHCTELFKDE
jgi:hypothetical protein